MCIAITRLHFLEEMLVIKQFVHTFAVVVFKIMGVEDTRFVEKANFRVGKINLNLSACDVAWNPTDGTVLSKFFRYTCIWFVANMW